MHARALTLLLLSTLGPGCLLPIELPDTPSGPVTPEDLARIRLPEGFRIDLFAEDVPGARSMTLGPEGTLFVGTRAAGKVYALRDEDGDGRAEPARVIAAGLDSPNGVAFREGALYVAEISRILRFEGIESRLDDPPAPVVVRDDLPDEPRHGWKFIAFSPEGLLYVPVGAPCNVCESQDERFASILRMRPDGSGLEVFARGVRNTVGFDWHPETRELWFTDNGRDWMGDDQPPDELNRAPVPGLHFGFPYWHGVGIADPDFTSDRPAGSFTLPELALGPHVAALGMRFYTGAQFPPAWQGRIFVAEHGSWNRREKTGYRVTTVTLEGGRAVRYEPFATGWLEGDDNWGRPVDVQVMSDGALLVSDDSRGVIYRISYQDLW